MFSFFVYTDAVSSSNQHLTKLCSHSNDVSYAWFPPFRCRAAVAVLPFRSAVPLYRCRSAVP